MKITLRRGIILSSDELYRSVTDINTVKFMIIIELCMRS